MSDYSPAERLEDLLAERALFGLSDIDQQELDKLLAESDLNPEAFELAAAAAQCSSLPEQRVDALPAALRGKILATASHASSVEVSEATKTVRPESPATNTHWAGWLMVAASILFAAFLFSRPSISTMPSPAELRSELLAKSKQPESKIVEVAWTRGEDPTGTEASGEVVWDPEKQAGVMRFRGLAANDPTKTQYQLWIFDADRDERYPVDGGVFDIRDDQGDTLVPIDARLPVSKATLFAITVEPPGGVVVSTRERLPLLAAVEPAK